MEENKSNVNFEENNDYNFSIEEKQLYLQANNYQDTAYESVGNIYVIDAEFSKNMNSDY